MEGEHAIMPEGRPLTREKILASEFQPIEVRLESGLNLRLRPLSAVDADRIAELDKSDVRPREKIIRVLYQQLDLPPLTEVDLEARSDAELITIFRAWAASPDTFDVILDDKAGIDEANRAIVSFVRSWTKDVRILANAPVIALATAAKQINVERFADPLGIGSLARRMNEIERSTDLTGLKGIIEGMRAVDIAREFNVPLSLARMFEPLRASAVVSWPGAGLTAHLDILHTAVRAPDDSVSVRALSMTKTSLLAQSALAGLDLTRIADRLAIPENKSRALTTAVNEHFRAFGGLVEALAKSVPSADARLTYELPAIEVFNEAELVRALAGTSVKDDTVEEREVRRGQIVDELDAEVPDLLRQIDPALADKLEGAWQSLRGNNVDRARHVLVSLRTLIDDVLNILAPEREVKAWCGPDDLRDNGQVKREARFRYLGRNLNFERLQRAFDADMKALNELYGVLNALHVGKLEIGDKELTCIIVRVEGALRWVILTAQK